jgi:hypothetical protein
VLHAALVALRGAHVPRALRAALMQQVSSRKETNAAADRVGQGVCVLVSGVSIFHAKAAPAAIDRHLVCCALKGVWKLFHCQLFGQLLLVSQVPCCAVLCCAPCAGA